MKTRSLVLSFVCGALVSCSDPPSAPVTSSEHSASRPPAAKQIAKIDDAEEWSQRSSLPVLEGQVLQPLPGIDELEFDFCWRIRGQLKRRGGGRVNSSGEAERIALQWLEERFGKMPDGPVKLLVESVEEQEDHHVVRLMQSIHGIRLSTDAWIEVDRSGVFSVDFRLCRFEVVPNSVRRILTSAEAVDAKFEELRKESEAEAAALKEDLKPRLSYTEIRSNDLRDHLGGGQTALVGFRTRWVPEWTLDPIGRYTIKAFRRGLSPEAKSANDRERAAAWAELTRNMGRENWTGLSVLPVIQGKPLTPPKDRIVEYKRDATGFMKYSPSDDGWHYHTWGELPQGGQLTSQNEAVRAAKDWLSQNFGPEQSDFPRVVVSVEEPPHYHNVAFRQYFHGIPIDEYTSVSPDQQGIVVANVNLFRFEIVPDSARTIVSPEQAVETWFKLLSMRDKTQAEVFRQQAKPRLIYRRVFDHVFRNEEDDSDEFPESDDKWVPSYEVDAEGLFMIDAFTGRAWFND